MDDKLENEKDKPQECSHESIKLTGKFETEKLHCDKCGFCMPF